LLFRLLKIPAKLALLMYCRNLRINNRALLYSKGPLLIAANHPNSFLDAIIIATLFKQPIYSLARGDAFKNKAAYKLFSALNIMPVYRISEGAENLGENYHTFDKCKEIFKKNGIVLIFSEGLCINEWKLRKLKKGTARLAFSSWEEGIDLTILPVGINYHSFSSFGKNVQLNFGNAFGWDSLERKKIDGHTTNAFNQKLTAELQQLVIEIDAHEKELIKNRFQTNLSPFKKIVLYFPALAGKWVHAPLYIPLQKISWSTTADTGHYDSVLTGLLFILYPVYLLGVMSIIYACRGGWYSILPMLLLPFLAWAYVQYKEAFKN